MKPTAIILMLGAVLVGPAVAQTEEDGPGRGVARISVMNGEVSVRRGDSGDLVAAGINAPLVVTDRLLTGSGSRAEVQFDYSNMIRIGALSEIRLSELEYQRYQIQVAVGTVTFRVLRDTDAQVEISTPNVSVRPMRRGIYRVSVHEDGSSEITVRSGEADIFTPRGSERLTSGRTMMARGSASDPEFQVMGAIQLDEWDRWNEARDRDLERSRSYQYVSRDIYGAEDLDGHGTWVQADTHGWVWAPRVAVGWAPYRYGRWSWIDYYGWSWVSYDPWGWAPYHYGRWFHTARYGWCWWPGGFQSRHYWRPALVAFFGWGHYGGYRSGIGFGWGNVGWVPLAPNEPFYPWYGRRHYGGYRGTTIINNTTIVNNTNIGNTYRNARITNGVSGVASDNFGRRHITNDNLVRVSNSDIAQAGLVRGALPVTPARESVRFADRSVRAADLPRTADDRRFFSRRQPAAVERVPFEQQQRSIEQVARRTFGDEPGRGATPGVRAAEPGERGRSGDAAPARTAEGERGWRRVGGDSAGSDAAPRVREPETRTTEPANNSGGWRRSGESATPSVERESRSPVTETPRTVSPTEPSRDPGARSGGDRGSNWRRFGDPTPRQERTERPTVDRPSRSESPSRSEPARPAPERSAPPPSRERSAPSQERSSPPAERTAPSRTRDRSDAGWQRFGNPGGESSRVSSFDAPASSRSFEPRTMESRPAPERRWETQSAPRVERSQPVRISPPIVRERSAPAMQSRPDFGGSGGMRSGGGGGGSRMESRGGGGGGGSPARSSAGSGGSSRSSNGGGGGQSGGSGGGGRGRR